MTDTLHESLRAKTRAILGAGVGAEATARLHLGVDQTVHAVIARAYPELSAERAFDFAFHLTDWREDGAFLIALALQPEQFTREEVEAGISAFLVHAPNHIAAAAKLGGWPIEDIFELGVLGPDEEFPGRAS